MFLSIFNSEPNRHDNLRTILREVSNSRGTLEIYTSTLTIVEVSFIVEEKAQRQLEPSTIETIEALLDNNTIVTQVEVNRYIARKARDYVREAMVRNLRLKPPDAIHLSTFASSGRKGCVMLMLQNTP